MQWFHILWTILLFILFLCLAVWAWSGRRKKSFERAAQIPLEDDATLTEQKPAVENSNG